MDADGVRRILQSSFRGSTPFSSDKLVDRNPGQDGEDVRLLFQGLTLSASSHDLLMHGSYALPYLSESALRAALPMLLIASLEDGFRYQPILDAVVIGVQDTGRNWGRHLPALSESERRAVSAWLEHLMASGRYDPYLVGRASQSLEQV